MAGKFEDNLLRDLLRDHHEALAAAEQPRPRPSTGPRVVVGLAAAAAAAVLLVGIGAFAQDTPAYAVTENPNGTVTILFNDIEAIEPANRQLREMGVRVKAVPTTKDCPPDPRTPDAYYQGPAPSPEISLQDNSITIEAEAIPEGHLMVVTISPRPDRGTGIGFSGLRKAPGPSCLLDPADDPETSTGD